MSLHAFDDVSDALDATRSFLFPFDRSKWLKLAVIVFFVGGFGSQFSSSFNYAPPPGSDGGGSPTASLPPWIAENVWLVVGAILGAFVLVIVLLAVVSSVMQFVFIEALRGDGAVRIRGPFRTHFWKGVRLFAFQTVAFAVMFGPPILIVAYAVLGLVNETMTLATAFPLFVIAMFLLVMLALVVGLVTSVTISFVAPVMLLESRGVISGWRRFWPTLRREWKEYLAYVVISFVLGLFASLAVALAFGIAFLVLLIPFGIVGGLTAVAGLSLGSTTAAAVVWWLFAFEVVLFLFATLVAVLLFAVPVHTYLRYYALLVLGDTEEAFDVIPDRRAAVRQDDDTAAAA